MFSQGAGDGGSLRSAEEGVPRPGEMDFVEGIEFTFPSNTMLGPGDYIVVCNNATVLRAHYGLTTSEAIGDFSGVLDNAGERLTLLDDSEPPRIIDTVRYNDNPPWPLAPDQDGRSLEVLDATEDHSIPENWRAAHITLVRANAARPPGPGRRPISPFTHADRGQHNCTSTLRHL